MKAIHRKTLLYKSEVEYGMWAINHILGCAHGCKFPCYAYMMSKKFGRIKSYKDWLKPRIVINALELLEKELIRYRNKIDFVHLSFMTDPFMYDIDKNELITDIKLLTLELIERINREGIKVTVLTKGFFPEEILDNGFLKGNEYGITIVSLNKEFRQIFEPFSASYNKRIDSLKEIHNSGFKTWVSMEPYPTPNLDETAYDIENLLEKISFVDKIIFGKLNYNSLSLKFNGNEIFYNQITERFIKFCEDKKIKYHIKNGTPNSREETKNILNL